jgi:hypothetical protein
MKLPLFFFILPLPFSSAMRSNLICVAGCKASYYTCAFFRISLHLFIAPISPHQTLHTYTVVVKSVDIIFSDFGFRFRFLYGFSFFLKLKFW